MRNPFERLRAWRLSRKMAGARPLRLLTLHHRLLLPLQLPTLVRFTDTLYAHVAHEYPVTEALRSTTRWDDIRKANAGGAQQSSWEKLRQEKERPGPSAGSSSQAPAESFPSYSDDDRTRQQAEFDALVEAERRLGSQDSSTRFDGAVSS
jgi:hypothetical protein